MRYVAAFLAACAALVLAPSIPAFAHEVGAIHVSTHQVPVGGTLTVRGEKLPKSSALTLELRGVLDNYPAGSVHTDTAGAFEMSLTVPQNVPAGPYTLVVVASDGDVTARADLAVGGAATTTASTGSGSSDSSMAGMPGMGGHATSSMGEERARADAMTIAHTTTPLEWIVIWGLIVVSLGAGIALVRRGNAHAAS